MSSSGANRFFTEPQKPSWFAVAPVVPVMAVEPVLPWPSTIDTMEEGTPAATTSASALSAAARVSKKAVTVRAWS